MLRNSAGIKLHATKVQENTFATIWSSWKIVQLLQSRNFHSMNNYKRYGKQQLKSRIRNFSQTKNASRMATLKRIQRHSHRSIHSQTIRNNLSETKHSLTYAMIVNQSFETWKHSTLTDECKENTKRKATQSNTKRKRHNLIQRESDTMHTLTLQHSHFKTTISFWND